MANAMTLKTLLFTLSYLLYRSSTTTAERVIFEYLTNAVSDFHFSTTIFRYVPGKDFQNHSEKLSLHPNWETLRFPFSLLTFLGP